MKKTYLVGALMIGASMIFARPIKAQANPTAGVTAYIQGVMSEPPITEWQKNILKCATDEEEMPKKRKVVKKVQEKKENNHVTIKRSNKSCLNRTNGVFAGPSGKETYYNLNMQGCIRLMEALGYNYRFWIREDGVKMYGNYVMCAADLSIRPKGTILQTSLGTGIVCDTGSFVNQNRYQLDIATAW